MPAPVCWKPAEEPLHRDTHTAEAKAKWADPEAADRKEDTVPRAGRDHRHIQDPRTTGLEGEPGRPPERSQEPPIPLLMAHPNPAMDPLERLEPDRQDSRKPGPPQGARAWRDRSPGQASAAARDANPLHPRPIPGLQDWAWPRTLRPDRPLREAREARADSPATATAHWDR